MGKYVGVWIDHDKAFVVSISDGQQTVTRIESNVEGRYRLSGGSRSRTLYGPQEIASDKKIEERRRHQLRRYYRKVITEFADSLAILVFGPGKAKIELQKELEKTKALASKVVGSETTDKMTERQIAAKVRKFFASDSPKAPSKG
ncbi:MAG: hypothetical protein JSV55_00455 [Deltaproteobacteria bacterium]|nr:MAG: hypothetical protein JSV40_11790 [Deltaproteobacteria bacterium]UCH07506.1 MAG: hypothetical protein JSV55_00455 [Deltaproteobacteria bacterium]